MSQLRVQGLVKAIQARNIDQLAHILEKQPGAIPPRAVVEAGRLGWKRGLALLKKRGADFNASYKNYRALHALLQEKPHDSGRATPERLACLAWLLANGADPELTAAWPAARALVMAAFVGDTDYVKVLTSSGAKVDLFTAAALGDAARVKALLDHNADLARARDAGGVTALQCCAGSRLGEQSRKTAAGLLKVAELLIDAGADVNARTRSWGHDVDVSYFAIGSGQIEVLRLLLDRGADPIGALPTAAWKGDATIIDLLLRHGALIDRAQDGGRPILNELVRWGQFAQARLLLARGASPDVPDGAGWTAVHQAASRGNLRMLEDLLGAGADANRRDHSGCTAADVARAKGRSRLVALLTR
jgi:ankyrin repeat protein